MMIIETKDAPGAIGPYSQGYIAVCKHGGRSCHALLPELKGGPSS